MSDKDTRIKWKKKTIKNKKWNKKKKNFHKTISEWKRIWTVQILCKLRLDNEMKVRNEIKHNKDNESFFFLFLQS